MFLYIFAGFLTIASYSCEILLKAGRNIRYLTDIDAGTLLETAFIKWRCGVLNLTG
jgi:hypothetical protein